MINKQKKKDRIIGAVLVVLSAGLGMGGVIAVAACSHVSKDIAPDDVNQTNKTAPVPTKRAVADTMLVVGAYKERHFTYIMAVNRNGTRYYLHESGYSNPKSYTNVGDTVLVGGIKKNIVKNISLQRRCDVFTRTR